MFKKLSNFFKNLFNPSKKEVVQKKSTDFNTKPQDLTWKDKQDQKLKDLEDHLDDSVVNNNDPQPTPQPTDLRPKDPVVPIDFSIFSDLINHIEGRGFVETAKGLYRLERPGSSFEVNLVERKIYKVMGLTNISASFNPNEGIDKVERFLAKHLV